MNIESKICIIGTSNLKHISLISLYTNFFDREKIKYDLIYIDRYGVREKSTALNSYIFRAKLNYKSSKVNKAFVYLGFRKFVKSILKKNNYDMLITWQTSAAYIIGDVLIKKYAVFNISVDMVYRCQSEKVS